MTQRPPQRSRSQDNGWQTWDRRFPVVMKFGGLFGAVLATVAAFFGVDLGAGLLGLFGTMMTGGILWDTMVERRKEVEEDDRRG